MTKAEFSILAKGIKAVYPTANVLPDDAAMSVWYALLQDLPYSLTSAAVQKYMSTNHFPPTPADIREAVASAQLGPQRDWLQGWTEVTHAIRKYGYMRPQEALEAIRAADPIAATTAEMIGWQTLCCSENAMSDRANFRTCYETATKREKEAAQLSPVVREMLTQAAQQLQIGDGK